MILPQGRSKKAALDVLDLPRYARETLGLNGLTLSTDLLAGSDRARLESIRERADRASCACLLLAEHEPQAFGSKDLDAIEAAVIRSRKVVEAAQLLGCSAASIKVAATDDEQALLRAVGALKSVVERAEKLDMNLLLAPHDGLTSKPERLTELLKRVGGFRIGTHPDFESAAASGDPVGYLHRLTPYATSVTATIFTLLEDEDVPLPPSKGKAAGKTPVATGKKAKGAAAAQEPEQAIAEDAEDDAIDDIDALIDDVAAEMDDDEVVLKALKHSPYDLRPLMGAVSAVGYDGPLAIDYRGKDDPSLAIVKARDTLKALLEDQRRTGG
jgi:sugar phosphate isomerase/epimerase